MSKLTLVTAPLLVPKTLYSLPTNLLKVPGTNLLDFEDHTEWTDNHGVSADDAVNYKEGTQGVKVTADVGGEGEIQKAVTWSAIGDKETSFWCYVPDASEINGGSCKIQLYDSSGLGNRKEVLFYFFDGWNLVKLGPGDWTCQGTGTVNDAITFVRFRHASPGGVAGVITYDAFYMQQKSEPAVVFTFDDGLDDIYNIAYPIMKARNIVGTCYVITDDIGTPDNMTWAQLVELQAAGWCIANHSKDHTDLTTLNEADCETNITAAVTAMTTNGITGNGPYHLSYPGGAYNATVWKAMSDQSFLTGRTIGQARHPALPMDRPYEIFRMFDLDDGVNLATAKGHIDDFETNGKPGYILGHGFGAAAGANSWATSDFTELCDYIADKRMANLTIEDAYQLQSGSRMVHKAR
ncbi:MAG: polysaccharide deacetylase family protein [Anaerolineales bacterium]